MAEDAAEEEAEKVAKVAKERKVVKERRSSRRKVEKALARAKKVDLERKAVKKAILMTKKTSKSSLPNAGKPAKTATNLLKKANPTEKLAFSLAELADHFTDSSKRKLILEKVL